MEKKIITGVASFGMSGKVFHCPLIACHKGFILKSIVERSKNEAQKIYPNVSILRSVDELLNDKEIELVIINTPDHTHAELAHKALQAGKNVIVEKPFTLHAGEAEDLLNLSIHKNLLLTVYQSRRLDGDFVTVQKIIKNRVLGRLVEYEAHYDRYRTFIQNSWKEEPENGTGMLYNLGSHLIDQALTLFGMPEAVSADVRTFRSEGKVDDYFEVILHYNTHRVALKGSYLVKQPGPRFVIHGIDGSFIKYGIDPQEQALKDGLLPVTPNWGHEPEEDWGILNAETEGLHYIGKIETLPGNYLTFYNNIYDALVYGKELLIKPQEAINVIKIIEAAYESSSLCKKIIIS